MKNVLRFLILLGLATFLVGLNLSCKKTTPSETPTPSVSKSQAPQEDNLTNLDPTSVQEQITANYNTAKQKASSWKPDAVLYSASAKITSSIDFEDIIEVYTFGSTAEPSYWWTISISVRSKNYVRAIIPKEDYLGANLVPTRTQYWKVNYVQAFQTAETNGGKEWREKQKDSKYQITATLAHGEPKGYLYWLVEYQLLDGSDKKTIQIDANSGEVINE